MENRDEILDSLKEFEKTPTKDIPPVLEDYFRSVAKTGKTLFPWHVLKTAFIQKLEQVMEQFSKEDPCDRLKPVPNVENIKYEELRRRIVDAMHKFTGAPFTVQRICELVTQPKKHYTQCDKFMRGIEKNVMVVSTVDPAGRKIVSEARSLVNGLDTNGLNPEQSDENDITDGKPFRPAPEVDWAGNNVSTVWPTTAVREENKNNSNNVATDSEKKSEKVQDIKNETESAKTVQEDSEVEAEEKLVVTDGVVKKDSAPVQASAISSATGADHSSRHSDNSPSTTQATQDQSSPGDQQEEGMSHDENEPLVDEKPCDSDSQSEAISDNKHTDTSLPAKHSSEPDTVEGEPPEKKLKTDSSEEAGTTVEASDNNVVKSGDSSTQETDDNNVTADTNKESEPEATGDSEKEKQDGDDSISSSDTDIVDRQEIDSKTVTDDSQSECVSQNDALTVEQSENSLQSSTVSDSENTDMKEAPSEEAVQREMGDDSCDSTGFPASTVEEEDIVAFPISTMEDDSQDVAGTGATEVGAPVGEIMDTDGNLEPGAQDKKDLSEEEETVNEPPTSVDESEPMEQE